MKTKEFHKPFIKNLVIIMAVTMVTMISSHYVLKKLYFNNDKIPIFTSSDSYISSKSPSEESFDK